MDNNNTPSLGSDDGAMAGAGIGTLPTPEMDPANYLPDMDDFDLTEAEKIELLETLWNTMRAIVEIGANIGDIDPCGQIFGTAQELSGGGPDGVKSSFSKAMEMPTDHKQGTPHETE